MEKTNRFFILRLAGTLLAFGLLAYLLSQQGWSEILNAFKHIPLPVLLFCLVLMGVSRFAVAARWQALLSLPGMQLKFAQSVRITFAGLFASNFLPTTVGGDVIRLAGLLRVKYDPAYGAASLIADRLIGMAGMLLVLPLGLSRFLETIPIQLSASGFSITTLAGTIAPLDSAWWHTMWNKFRRFLQKLFGAFSIYLKYPLLLARAFLFTFVHMACVFSIFFMLFKSLGTPISWGLIAGLYSLVYLVTLLPVSINGYGLQEISIALIYSKVAGVPVENSITVALVYRTMMMLTSLPGALFLSNILTGEPEPKISSATPDQD